MIVYFLTKKLRIANFLMLKEIAAIMRFIIYKINRYEKM